MYISYCPFIFDRTVDGQRVAITISGHYDRTGSMLCRTNTDELTDQAAGTVYHCGPACAALANHSVTPILYPDQSPTPPPTTPWLPDPSPLPLPHLATPS